ncbi:MAG TPA: RNA helicase [Anaerolineae bacterium]|nr:RNA helicase [Anaerolineae bacterium]
MAGIAKSGYETPTPVQEQAIPAALAGHDLIATAQTGTGKTATFVLPILHKLLTGPRHRTRALIVTPTRELAEQINDNIRTLSAGTNLRSATIYGGVGTAPQVKALKMGVEILVACPGRLLDLAAQGLARLGDIEILVLDEADRMFDMGFMPDVRRIIKLVPAKRQTMLFSATFPTEVEKLAAETLSAPQRIAVGLSRPAHTVSHALYPVPKHLKTALTFEILKQTDTNSVLIFARTRHRAQSLSIKLSREGYRVTSLHSDRTQGQRQSALSGFKDGRYQIMVATDIAARGLDVDSISHVINFDIPDTADAYIHRIGRTGRAERTGDAFTLVTPDDDEMVRELEKIMQQRLPREVINGFNYNVPAPVQQIQPAPRGPKPIQHRPAATHNRDRKPHPPRR